MSGTSCSSAEPLEDRRLFAVFNVTTTTDGGAGSLRQAILDANANGNAVVDVINIPAGTYTLALAGAGEDAGATGDLDVTTDVTFNGAAFNTTIIQAGTTTLNGIDRVFDIRNGADATFNDLTIRHGLVTGNGAGIRNTGALTLDTVNVVFNHAVSDMGGETGDGGGIFTEEPAMDVPSGTTNITNSGINDNLADEDGGGIYHVPFSGALVIDDTDVNRNDATNGDAGGIYHVPGDGNLTITSSTIDENTALTGDAGGIYSVAFSGNASLTDTEVTDNRSSEGGGLYHVPRTGNLTMTNVMVLRNTSTGDAGGVFVNPLTGNLSITGGSISDNDASGVGGGIYITPANTTSNTITGAMINANTAGGEGGGINTDGTPLTISNSTLDENQAGGDGGAIEAEEDLTVINCTITNNTTTGSGDGGGINVNDVGMLSITDSTVDGNTAAGRGGGIRTSGDLTMDGNTVSNNDAREGGGLWLKQSTATITNSTFSGNFTPAEGTGRGGGIYLRSDSVDATLINVTVTNNTAAQGGGLFAESGDAAVTLVNTLVAGNNLSGTPSTGPDLSGPFISGGSNLVGIGDDSTGLTNGVNGDQVGSAASPINPMLGGLEDNGGPTRTHALFAGSPAIDRAEEDTAPGVDQRNVTRPQDGDGNGSAVSDIGAFELQPTQTPPPSISINNRSINEGNSGTTAFTFTLTRSGNTSVESSVNFATAFGTANSTDLNPQSGSVTFAAGQTTRTLTIQVKGDTTVEPNETFFVNLSSPSNATISDSQGQGTIVNDDAAPPVNTAQIRGHIFDDRDGNQTRGGGEPVLGGFTVYIDSNRNGRRDSGERSTTSDSAGNYRFNNLAAGTYLVRIVLQSGFRQTKPAGNGGHTVTLRTGQVVMDRGFGVTQRVAISGTVFRDSDRDGRLDSGESGVANRRVFIDADNDGRFDSNERSALTNAQGRFTLDGVPAGTIRLRVVLAGSTPTSPSNGLHVFTAGNGQVITGRNFGLR